MRKRILLVEDEPGLRLTLSGRLASEGHLVEQAADGATGLRRASSEPFDLVVLDVMLPDRSGFDVCRDLRKGGIDTPVLMLTARGQVEDRVLGLKLGADDYLVKPFAMSELLARVEARLRRSPAAARPPRAIASGDRRGLPEGRGPGGGGHGFGQGVPAPELPSSSAAPPSPRRALNEVRGYDAMPTTRTVGRARGPAAPEDRAEPAAAAVHPHRARPRLQVRGLRQEWERPA